jgi:DNA-binding PadR family transcriptional regulator
VLNLLNERPMHPYEMRTLMRERGHDRAFTIRESSVYDMVARLASRGFIEPVEVSREGRRPERTVYAITEAGRDELLMFIYGLGRDRAIAALRERAARLAAQISASDAFRRTLLAEFPGFPRLFGIEEEYAQAMRQAELEWVRATVAELRDGSLPWPAPEELPDSQTAPGAATPEAVENPE